MVRMIRPKLSPELLAMSQAFDLSADELSDAAEKAAKACHRVFDRWQKFNTPDDVIGRQLRGISKRHHITLPNKAGLQEAMNRLCDPSWWKRALRKRLRVVEYAAIQAGEVHAQASKYVSGKTMARAIRDKRRIAELLESMYAVNQTTGEMIPMDEIAAQSLANPQNRRMAMMARLKGIEQFEKERGSVALFLTITCPSRMHARHVVGVPNERHDGTSTRTAQAHLNDVWRCAKRKLDHSGVQFCGMRVTEPHHDSCPHWHVLIFVKPDHADTLIQVMRAYALRDSPDEPGASERRFVVEFIDSAKGSAVGYVAKYVSKSIDGEGVGTDDETGETGKDSAPRIVAWARVWGIRQFQFFGVPPITPTREMYRLKTLESKSAGLIVAHQAVRENNYGAYLHAHESYSLDFKPTYIERESTRYAGEQVQRLQGLKAGAIDLHLPENLTTRTDEWRIESRRDQAAQGEFSPPRTRFNNCALIEFIEVSGTSKQIETSTLFDFQDEKDIGGVAERKVPRAGHRYQTRGVSIGSRTPRSIAGKGKSARTEQIHITRGGMPS
jgi:hypothetical protein